MLNEQSKHSYSFYAVLFATAFGLNWIWEISQTFAFEMSGVGGGKMLLFCTFAAVIDGIVAIAIYWTLHKFFAVVNWKFYLVSAVFGALSAVFFEQMARHSISGHIKKECRFCRFSARDFCRFCN